MENSTSTNMSRTASNVTRPDTTNTLDLGTMIKRLSIFAVPGMPIVSIRDEDDFDCDDDDDDEIDGDDNDEEEEEKGNNKTKNKIKKLSLEPVPEQESSTPNQTWSEPNEDENKAGSDLDEFLVTTTHESELHEEQQQSLVKFHGSHQAKIETRDQQAEKPQSSVHFFLEPVSNQFTCKTITSELNQKRNGDFIREQCSSSAKREKLDERPLHLLNAKNTTTSTTTNNNNNTTPIGGSNFMKPIQINTNFTCFVDNQKSPQTQLNKMALDLEEEKMARSKLSMKLEIMHHEKESFEAKIKKLEDENQELKGELYYSKKIIKDLKSTSHENESHVSQMEHLRSENSSLKTDIQAMQMAVSNYSTQVEKLKKYEILINTINFCHVNNNRYQIVASIGLGGFSEVYHCIMHGAKDSAALISKEVKIKGSKSYAIKKVDLSKLDPENLAQVMNEIELLKKLQATGKVIQLYDHEYVKHKKLLFMVMELGSTDLNVFFKLEIQKHGSVREPVRSYYWHKMLEALHAVHREGVIHSDVKPSNFIVVGCEVKLIDFNISAMMTSSERTSITMQSDCGTLHYMAPEMLTRDDVSKTRINTKADIWSMGVILYFLVYGKLPFQHIKNQYKLLHTIIDPRQVDLNFPTIEDRLLSDCLRKCLAFEARDRLTAEQLLAHPYLSRKTV